MEAYFAAVAKTKTVRHLTKTRCCGQLWFMTIDRKKVLSMARGPTWRINESKRSAGTKELNFEHVSFKCFARNVR